MESLENDRAKVLANLDRIWGSIPWMKVAEKTRHRAKVFKSGNSLAVRLPAGTALVAGMEMDLTIEDGRILSLEPIDSPKRKFDIKKVAGSAPGLLPLRDEDRVFEERTPFKHGRDRDDGDPAK